VTFDGEGTEFDHLCGAIKHNENTRLCFYWNATRSFRPRIAVLPEASFDETLSKDHELNRAHLLRPL